MAKIEDEPGRVFSTQEDAIRAAKEAATKKLRSSDNILHAVLTSFSNLPTGPGPEFIEIKPLAGRGDDEFLLERDPTSGLYAMIDSLHDQPEGRPALLKYIDKDLPKRAKPKPVPIKVRFYAKSDDAVQALQLVKALTDFLEDVGYGRVKIVGVTRGSVMTDIKAWWNGEESQPAKKKMSEIGMYGEQWALDVTANKARAEVAAMNANTTSVLLASVENYETIAMLIDDFLVIKYVKPDGSPFAFVKKLSIKEMRTLDENAAILADPNTVLANLNLLSYAKGNNLELEGVDDEDQ